MATIYFIGDGGSNIWNSDVWSSSSGGGVVGSLRPTATDDVVFDANSGLACTVSATNGVCDDLDLSAWGAGTITIAASSTLTIHGTLTQSAGTFIKGSNLSSTLEIDGGDIPLVSGAKFGLFGASLLISIINGGTVSLTGESGYAGVTIDATSSLVLASSGVSLGGLGIANEGTCSGKLMELAGGFSVTGDGDMGGLSIEGVSYNGSDQVGSWSNSGNIAICESAYECLVTGAGLATLGSGPFHSVTVMGELESFLAEIIENILISFGGVATIENADINRLSLSGDGQIFMSGGSVTEIASWNINTITGDLVQYFSSVTIAAFNVVGTAPGGYKARVYLDQVVG